MKKLKTKAARAGGRRGLADAADRAMVDRLVARLKAGDDLRKMKVRRVKAAIHQQVYCNLLKLDVAADRLARELEEG
jgi:hypothetical protein